MAVSFKLGYSFHCTIFQSVQFAFMAVCPIICMKEGKSGVPFFMRDSIVFSLFAFD
jgi:hypothetical protein